MSVTGFKEQVPAKKQPWEEIPFSVDFTEWIDEISPSLFIQSNIVTVADEDGVDVTAAMLGTITPGNKDIKFIIKGGDDGFSYGVRIQVTLSDSSTKLEADLPISVLEK